jgi:quercetin dioxygenase-like cupin family protein
LEGDGLPRYGDVFENEVTGEYAVVIRGDEDGGGEPGLGHLVVKPGGAVVGEHVHPHFQERFRVISGELGARVDGVERTLLAGDEVTVPAGVPHDWWNAGDEEAGVLVEVAPLNTRFLEMLATLFGLANAGRTNAKGMPNPLQLALIGQEFSDVIVFTKPPRAVQKVAFGVLGGLGRLRGYRGIYPEYLVPRERVTPDPDVVALAGVTPPAGEGAQ